MPPPVPATRRSWPKSCGNAVRPGRRPLTLGQEQGCSPRLLLGLGSTVCAVEPNDEMRAQAQRELGAIPGFSCRKGTAEDTGLPDGSVSLVTARSRSLVFRRRVPPRMSAHPPARRGRAPRVDARVEKLPSCGRFPPCSAGSARSLPALWAAISRARRRISACFSAENRSAGCSRTHCTNGGRIPAPLLFLLLTGCAKGRKALTGTPIRFGLFRRACEGRRSSAAE